MKEVIHLIMQLNRIKGTVQLPPLHNKCKQTPEFQLSLEDPQKLWAKMPWKAMTNKPICNLFENKKLEKITAPRIELAL